MDQIIVKNLLIALKLGPNQWELLEQQPILLNITAYTTIANREDLLSLNYASLANSAIQFCENNCSSNSMHIIAIQLCHALLKQYKMVRITVKIEKSRALLHAKSVGIEITRSYVDVPYLEYQLEISKTIPLPPKDISSDSIFITDLTINCIIGIYPWERVERQRVILNMKLYSVHEINILPGF
jgi:dihydroneopterin aldolase/2-amino-4-hydroxy-6-hydroxymethyldihydropteridine diphosphokinase/dihydropteroate synthase